jgi:hypothetical protein
VFHEHIREPPREQVREEPVELVGTLPLAHAVGDHDPADARVARTRDPEPRRDRREQPPGIRVREPDGVEDPKGEDELRVDWRVEGHRPRMAGKFLCVWNTRRERRCRLEGCR